jgi:hypothetical protein
LPSLFVIETRCLGRKKGWFWLFLIGLFLLKSGYKVRLGKGALEYLRHRQERSLSRSLSQSDLATIEEVEEELNDNVATDAGRQVLTDIHKNSWYPQKAEYNIPKGPGSVQVTEESRKQLVEKATKVNSSGSSRVSRRTLEKLAEDYSKRKIGDNYAKLPPLPRSRNLTAHESSRSILEQSRNRAYELSSRSSVSSVEKTRENSSSSSLEPDYYSMYHGVFVEPNNSSDSCQGGTSALSEKEVENSSQGDNSLLLNQNGIDGAVTEEPKNLDPQMEFYSGRTLWEPPRVWKIPEYHQWTGHDMRTNEHGGWWTERWGCSLDKTFRFGGKRICTLYRNIFSFLQISMAWITMVLLGRNGGWNVIWIFKVCIYFIFMSVSYLFRRRRDYVCEKGKEMGL